MKTLRVLFLICALQYIKCYEELDSKVIIKTVPKTLQTPMQKSIKIINARKFNKLRKPKRHFDFQKEIYKKKDKKNSYTAFPPIADKGIIDSTENLYFQGLHVVDRKPRVKKVLPEYGLSVFRNKRSADSKINQTTISRRRNIKNNTVVGKTHKHLTKNVDRKVDKELTHSTKRARKHRSKTTKTHLRHGKKRPTVHLRYKEHDRNTSKSLISKKSHRLSKKIKKSNRTIKRHEERKVKNRRLIAGRDAMIQEYPYVVSIQKSGEHWCAGALLNQRLVITTANCIWKAHRVSKMQVRAGTRHLYRGGQVAKIMEVAKHPSWSIRGGPDNDLGLLLLDRNIKFSDKVHEVDLPNRAMWPAFDDVWVTSWGSNRRDGVYDSLARTLQVYHAMLIENNKCNNVTMRFGVPVTNNFICVAQTGRRAPCTFSSHVECNPKLAPKKLGAIYRARQYLALYKAHGVLFSSLVRIAPRDTGAPAVSDGILWGVASWGIRKLCGTERFPAMFSYLASKTNLDFITNATSQLMSDKRFYPFDDRFELKYDVRNTSTTA